MADTVWAKWRCWIRNSLLTDGCDEPVEVTEGEKRLRKFPEEQLEGAGDDVDVLPLAILQVQLLCWDATGAQHVRAQQGAPPHTSRSGSPLKRPMNIWCERYRDRPWSVVSVWRRGSRSLCTARRCPNLSVRQQPAHISVTHWQHGDTCRHSYDPDIYLSSPRLWHTSPQNVEPSSAPVHTAWPGGSQTRCLRPEETHGGKKIRSLREILLTSGK